VAEQENDGRFPDESDVLVRYIASDADARTVPRDEWPWMEGVVENQCGPDEWLVTVYDRGLAMLEDGSPAPEGTPGEDMYFPQCFRDSSELKLAPEEGDHA
jgi:hypothetical protein